MPLASSFPNSKLTFDAAFASAAKALNDCLLARARKRALDSLERRHKGQEGKELEEPDLSLTKYLKLAVDLEDEDEVAEALHLGADPNDDRDDYESAMYYLGTRMHFGILRLMLDAGGEIWDVLHFRPAPQGTMKMSTETYALTLVSIIAKHWKGQMTDVNPHDVSFGWRTKERAITRVIQSGFVNCFRWLTQHDQHVLKFCQSLQNAMEIMQAAIASGSIAMVKEILFFYDSVPKTLASLLLREVVPGETLLGRLIVTKKTPEPMMTFLLKESKLTIDQMLPQLKAAVAAGKKDAVAAILQCDKRFNIVCVPELKRLFFQSLKLRNCDIIVLLAQQVRHKITKEDITDMRVMCLKNKTAALQLYHLGILSVQDIRLWESHFSSLKI